MSSVRINIVRTKRRGHLKAALQYAGWNIKRDTPLRQSIFSIQTEGETRIPIFSSPLPKLFDVSSSDFLPDMSLGFGRFGGRIFHPPPHVAHTAGSR